MDELARRYLALALRIRRHVPDYVDLWLGPAALREAIDGERLTPPLELHLEAVELREMAALLPLHLPADQRRARWLEGQLTAMSALVRTLGGEEIAYVDLVEELYGIPAEPEPEITFATAHRLLDEVLPRGGSLAERLAAHRVAVRVEPEQVLAALERAASVLRERTRADLWLPASESVEWAGVRDRPWGASAPYLGALRTRVEVNLDLPVTLGDVVYLAAHEAYPGHHAERATKEAVLVREAGVGEARGEAMVACLHTPEIAISEGLAELAREVVMADHEMVPLFRRLVRDLSLSVEPAALQREVPVGRARAMLRRASANAALLLHADGEPERLVRDYLAETALHDGDRIDHEFRQLRDPLWRHYPFAYLAGPRLITEWLEVVGQSHGFARLLGEQLTPGQLRAEIGEPPRLYPRDFV